MKGTIVNFRRSVHTQSSSHMIIGVEGIADKEKAAGLVGKEVVWKNEKGTEIKGKVAAAHGNSGAIRVIFETGMPGQSKGTKVDIN
jgi:large subunit ribosomal protein L35Ae